MISIRIDDDGVLSVQHSAYVPSAGVARQALPVAGGAIEIDVRAPQNGLRAVLDDAAAAAWWLPFVFGVEAAEAVAELEASDAPSARTVSGAVEPDVDLDGVARRLLVGFWFRRWWPAGVVNAPVLEWLLDAELAVLAAEAEAVFGGVEIPAALLSDHLETIAADVRVPVQGTEGTLLPERAAVIQRAVLTAVDVVDDSRPGFVETLQAAESLSAAGGFAVPGRATPRSVMLNDLAGTRPGAPVDWTAVHPRQVSAAADAVRASIHETAGEKTVQITVDAPADIVSMPVEPGELYALVGDGPLAEAAALSPAGEQFVGSTRSPMSGIADVSISSDVWGTLTRSNDRERAVAVRADVLAIVRARLTATAKERIAPFAFERQLVEDAATRDGADAIVRDAAADLDLEWLLLSEAPYAYRGAPSSVAWAVVDEASRVSVLLAAHPRGWVVRVESLGADGEVVLNVRFASGAIRTVSVELEAGTLADAILDHPAGDAPVGVHVQHSPR